MTYVRPCRSCPKNGGCERQDSLRASIKGLGLLSVKFSCPEILSTFQPGMRVSVKLRKRQFDASYWEGGEGYYYLNDMAEYEGTIMRWSDGKLLIGMNRQVEDLTKPIVKVWPNRVRATGETAPICSDCGLPGDTVVDDWGCQTCKPIEDGE